MFRFAALIFLTLSYSGIAQAADPVLVSVPLSKAYIPTGFDSNDQPQVFVTGQFADLCYQVEKQDVQVDQVRQRITITQRAYHSSGKHCWGLKVPFEQVTQLPLLLPGDYEVRDGHSGANLGKLQINRVSQPATGTDDFLYAPVTEVSLKPKMPFGHSVVISGEFPNDCLKLLDVRVLVYADVVVVLPILQYVPSPNGMCTAGYYPFRQEQPLGQLLGQHPYLVHVRAMNGQAVNRLIDPYKKFPADPISPQN